jgi:hypothetical protein
MGRLRERKQAVAYDDGEASDLEEVSDADLKMPRGTRRSKVTSATEEAPLDEGQIGPQKGTSESKSDVIMN